MVAEILSSAERPNVLFESAGTFQAKHRSSGKRGNLWRIFDAFFVAACYGAG
jgi:hypothetical protein